MTRSSTAIEIVLINNKKQEGQDDQVVIRKNLETNDFTVTYTEKKDREVPLVYRSVGMYESKVLNYIYILLKNQYLDAEPYAFIQVNVPAMPRIMIPGEKFNEIYYREHVEDLIQCGLEMLETTTIVKKPVLLPVPLAEKKSHWYSDSWGGNVLEEGELPSPFETPRVLRRSTAPGVVPQHLFFNE